MAPALTAAMLLGSSSAWADRVALLPSQGGTDATARAALDGDMARGLTSLGHTVVPVDSAAVAAAGVVDGVADTPEEYRAVSAATRTDWVVAGNVEPAVRSSRVEITAFLAQLGRVESVAREVDNDRRGAQVTEMLTVLIRPEGIGVGALPWEQAAPPPVPAPPTQQPPAQQPPAQPGTTPFTMPFQPMPTQPPPVADVNKARVNYPLGEREVWPAYSGGHRFALGAALGFGLPVVQPEKAAGGGAALVGAVRAAYAVGDSGLEPFIELGGNLAGPRALWLSGGARWLFNPLKKRDQNGILHAQAVFLGPSLEAGMFLRLGSEVTTPNGNTFSTSSQAYPALGASFDLVYALSPTFQLEARPLSLRWVPASSGSLLFLGATVGGALRF